MGTERKTFDSKRVLIIALIVLGLGLFSFLLLKSIGFGGGWVYSFGNNGSQDIKIQSAVINPESNKTLEVLFDYSNGEISDLYIHLEDLDGRVYSNEVDPVECSRLFNSTWRCLFSSDEFEVEDFGQVSLVNLASDSSSKSAQQAVEFVDNPAFSEGIIPPSSTSSNSSSKKEKSSGGGGGGGGGESSSSSCVPSKTCEDYSGLCGSYLNDGCNNALNCYNNCAQGYNCIEGVCILSCVNDMGCSSEGGFCEGITPYNCTLNVTSGCFYRTNLPSCPESCYGGECVSVSLIDSCTEITAPGSYLLSQDITNNSIIWACIKILSSGVTLDCNNKFILSSSSATGIYANQSTTIKNCNISVGANSPGYGIEVYRASGVIIEGNVLNDQYSGIYLLESNNSQIRNNVIKYNTNKGIHLSSGFNNTIKDNLISSGEFYGILLTISSGNLIINNTIDSNGWYGILVEASLDNSPDGENNITNNTILNSRTGVYVKTSRNRITWNLIDNSTLYHGLYIYGGNSTTIHGNTLTNSAQYGLRIRNSNENIISNNVIRFNGQQGLELSGNSLGNVFSTNVICSNSPDVTCASNQVFSDNYCDSGLVCGGTCNVCSLFSGFAIANFTGDLINSGQRHRIPLIIALVLTIILTLVIILIINSKKKVTNSRYRKY